MYPVLSLKDWTGKYIDLSKEIGRIILQTEQQYYGLIFFLF